MAPKLNDASFQLAQSVRNHRKIRGWTQDDLSARSGLSHTTIQRVERGELCSSETLKSLSAVFSVSIPSLMGTAHSSFEGASTKCDYIPTVEIGSGKSLSVFLRQSEAIDFDYDEIDNVKFVDPIGEFYDTCKDNVGEKFPDNPRDRLRLEIKLSEQITGLREIGLSIAGQVYNRVHHDVFDDGDGMAILMGKYDEKCLLIRIAVGHTPRDRVMITELDLPQYCEPKDSLIVRAPRDVEELNDGKWPF